MRTVLTFSQYCGFGLQVSAIPPCGFSFWKTLIHNFWIIFVAADKFWWHRWLFVISFMKLADFLFSILKIRPRLPRWCCVSLLPVSIIGCFVLGPIFFVLQQSIISSTSHLSCALSLSLFWIDIRGSGGKTCLGNRLLGAKYSFHRWKIGVKPVSFMCWGFLVCMLCCWWFCWFFKNLHS